SLPAAPGGSIESVAAALKRLPRGAAAVLGTGAPARRRKCGQDLGSEPLWRAVPAVDAHAARRDDARTLDLPGGNAIAQRVHRCRLATEIDDGREAGVQRATCEQCAIDRARRGGL